MSYKVEIETIVKEDKVVHFYTNNRKPPLLPLVHLPTATLSANLLGALSLPLS
jgi:hypothetical protein